MYVPSNSPKYTCYKCRNKIPTKDLEEIYHKQLENYILSPDVISDQLDQLDQNIKEKNEQLNALLEEEKKNHREMDKLYKAYIDDDITSKTYGIRNQPLEERFLQIEDQIPELQADIDFQKIRYLSSDQILNEARSLYSQWQHFSPEAKRQLIEQITEKIVIGTDEIEITLSYIQSPPFSKEMTKGVANLDDCPTFCCKGLQPLVMISCKERTFLFRDIGAQGTEVPC
jgi:site-specific DNA recombinase